MHPYAHLFQPLRLGRTVLKNRIEAAPVSVANLTPQAHFTPDNIAIFERKAKGGAAIVNMGEARIDLKQEYPISCAWLWMIRKLCLP